MREVAVTVVRNVGARRLVRRAARYLVAAVVGALGLGAVAKGVAVLGGACTVLCRPDVSLSLGALAGLLAVAMVEMDERG